MARARPGRRIATCSGVLAAVLLASPIAAAAPPMPQGIVEAVLADDAPAGRDPNAAARRRLLHAVGGGVLRAQSRLHDGRWEVWRDERWEPLPDGLVSVVRLEAEVLDEWRSRRARIRRTGSASEQAELAGWGLTEGLHAEALAVLDEILVENPDDASVRTLLARPDFPIRIDGPGPVDEPAEARRERLLQLAGRAPPALRELAVAKFIADVDSSVARIGLLPRLRDPSSGVRASAALALRRLPAEELPQAAPLGELLRRTLLDRDPGVRQQAALTLRAAGDVALIVPLVAALESPHAIVRVNAVEGLQRIGHREAVVPLAERLFTLRADGRADGFRAPRGHIFVGRQSAFVQGYAAEVAQGAAIARPQVGTLQEGASLDVAVLGASASAGPSHAGEVATLRRALEELTGAKPGNTTSAWKQWWARHGDAWSAPTGSPPGSDTGQQP